MDTSLQPSQIALGPSSSAVSAAIRSTPVPNWPKALPIIPPIGTLLLPPRPRKTTVSSASSNAAWRREAFGGSSTTCPGNA